VRARTEVGRTIQRLRLLAICFTQLSPLVIGTFSDAVASSVPCRFNVMQLNVAS